MRKPALIGLAVLALGAAAWGVSASGEETPKLGAREARALQRELQDAATCEQAAAVMARMAAEHPEAVSPAAREALESGGGAAQCGVGADVEVLEVP